MCVPRAAQCRSSVPRKMELLNLFRGIDSVANPWREAGHEVTSMDIDGRYHREIVCRIL